MNPTPLILAAGAGALADHAIENSEDIVQDVSEALGIKPHEPDERELLMQIAHLLMVQIQQHSDQRTQGIDVESSMTLTTLYQRIRSSERQYVYIYTSVALIVNYLVPGLGTQVLNFLPGWNALPLRSECDIAINSNNVTTTQNVRIRICDNELNGVINPNPLVAYDANGNLQELNVGGNAFSDNDGVIRAHALQQVAKTMRNGPMTQNGLAAATTSNQLNTGTPAPFTLLFSTSVAGTVTFFLNGSNGGTLGQLLKPDGSGALSVTATAGTEYALQCPPAQNVAIQVSAGPTNITLQAIGYVGG